VLTTTFRGRGEKRLASAGIARDPASPGALLQGVSLSVRAKSVPQPRRNTGGTTRKDGPLMSTSGSINTLSDRKDER
jgi:hypothetical protein